MNLFLNVKFVTKLLLATLVAFLISACSSSAPTIQTFSLYDCEALGVRCTPNPDNLYAENTTPLKKHDTAGIKTVAVEPPKVAPILFGFNANTAPLVDLHDTVEFLTKHRDAIVTLHGHTDPLGSASYNLRLSKQRALHIKERLTLAGVPNHQIRIEAHGEADLEVLPSSIVERTLQDQVKRYAPNRRVTLEFSLTTAVAIAD